MFGVPFEQTASLIDRSPQAARQLGSRARRRVRAQPTTPDVDVSAQREVVNAFLAAAREGDFDALAATLDPDVVLRADGGGGALAAASAEVRGALDVARRAVIAEMDFLADPERLARLDLTILDDRDWQPTGTTAQTRCRPRHQLLTFVTRRFGVLAG